jgi:hypothetical protein
MSSKASAAKNCSKILEASATSPVGNALFIFWPEQSREFFFSSGNKNGIAALEIWEMAVARVVRVLTFPHAYRL